MEVRAAGHGVGPHHCNNGLIRREPLAGTLALLPCDASVKM